MLTGTNRDYIDARIPHLSKLLVSDLNSLVQDSEVLIINTKEEEFKALASEFSDKIIIDFVRLDESLLNNENYIGINWSSVVEDQQNFVSGEDTVLN